tara:strand:- start:7477 stop:7950 length:474 start_codon:yes stop_codon:yes gene_type:complete
MKAIQINGAIKKYITIPNSWGNVIGGFDLLLSSDWEEAGFYDVVTPDYDNSTQYLGDIEWDADNSQFTYPVINKTWTQTVAELKESKIANLKSIYNRKLEETDWYIIRASEGGTATPQSILDNRAALRTECGTKEAEINALTTKAAIASYSLPSLYI